MACLVSNDTLIKLAGATLPVGELMLLRGALASLLIAAICLYTGALRDAGKMLAWQVSGRAFANLAVSVCYLSALLQMPIANLTAMMQATPLVLTALAALLLGEKVGWRRWLAIAAGFGGVLLIVRPASADFNLYAWLAVATIGFVALRDLVTRAVEVDTPSSLVTLATSLAVTGGGAVICLFQGWQPFGWREAAFIAPSAVLLVAGYQLVIVGFRSGEISVVAPFRFSLVVWAILLGYLVWSELPDSWTLAGIGLIVAMGIYTFHRERVLAARAEPLAAGTRREI